MLGRIWVQAYVTGNVKLTEALEIGELVKNSLKASPGFVIIAAEQTWQEIAELSSRSYHQEYLSGD